MSNQCRKCGRPISADEAYCALCAPKLLSGYKNNEASGALYSPPERSPEPRGEAANSTLREMQRDIGAIADSVSTIKKIIIALVAIGAVSALAACIAAFVH